jgi:hypothetical protein
MRALAAAFVLPLAGCLQVDTGAGTDGGAGRNQVPTTARASDAGSDAGPAGTNCFEDLRTQTVLCELIDTCPGVGVDPGVFPNCGFRMHASSPLDLECLCGDAVCPVGVPTNCDEARQLLAAQSALVICQQQAEGRCVQLVAAPLEAGGTCDKTCRSECAGVPSCLQLCGC